MDTHMMLSIDYGTPMDDARHMIYHEIQQLEYGHQMLALRSQLNMFTYIARVPPEILLQIFVAVTENGEWPADSTQCIPVTHVCRQWRSIALNAPALWSNLLSDNVAWTMAMLDRSKASPLTVSIHSSDAIPVLKHLSRIRSLTIEHWSADDLQKLRVFIEENASVAPQLEVLSLSSVSNSPWSLPSTTFQQADRLKDLFLDGIQIDWTYSPFFRHLTKLRLQTILYDGQPTWRELITALDQMPALESLFIDNMLPKVTFDAALDAVSAYLPSLKSVGFRFVPTVHAMLAFLNQVNLPTGLKVFNVVNIDDSSNSQQIYELCHAISRSIPGLCSRARYMDIMRPRVSSEIYIHCFATLQEFHRHGHLGWDWERNPADIALRLSYLPELDRTMVVVTALDILNLSHITYLSASVSVGRPEFIALLTGLPELQVIQVCQRPTKHLVHALNTIQPHGPREGALILPKLREIHICTDYFKAEDVLITDDTWQDLKAFLEFRQSLQAGVHKLYIRRCRHISREMVEGLKKCVDDLCWDGMCKEDPDPSRYEMSLRI
ncbi:hypothetical protein D9619_011762 [Psilocybe cf. subviscida]|uniref:F-box domain-containing protein n=1 Tax=Psilocybe cf. subviscida TaxID=2480587 RepID=A0A8H5EVU2_9AGAR|nr:hypothetical protein D9619_011762 [Psilocybe cf. subviscida]